MYSLRKYVSKKNCSCFKNDFLQGKISDVCGEVTVRGLEADEKLLALEVHNRLRAKLANGLELRGDPGPQPSASNMMQLVTFSSDF